MSDFLKTMSIAASGLRAQAGRMRIISENIANADSTPATPGADPYRRKVPTFSSELDRSLEARVVGMGKQKALGNLRGGVAIAVACDERDCCADRAIDARGHLDDWKADRGWRAARDAG